MNGLVAFWGARDWAEAIARLPASGALPRRTVLVPREAVAHSLRRELVRQGRGAALAGTRFIPSLVAATDVLHTAGVGFRPGEEALRPVRLAGLFRSGLALEHFRLDLLRSRPGWDAAFARTIADLEAGGLRPEALLGDAAAQLRDIGAIWRAMDEAAGSSWTVARIYAEAARLLEQRPEWWPHAGAALAAGSASTAAVQARFVRAIPHVTIGLRAARPVRRHALDRIGALFGPEAAALLESAAAPRAAGSERDLVASYLFEAPALLADPARPRSAGPDGTVRIEQHSGVEEEIEAAADWVAEQIADGMPLEDVALLAPAVDPFAELIAARLARLPWRDGAFPVHVAGGLPLTSTATGARALAVVRALRGWLPGDALADLLPALRTVEPAPAGEVDRRHLSRGAAVELVWSLGTAGGNAARPAAALEWSARAARREEGLAMELARAGSDAAEGDDPEQAAVDEPAWRIERALRDVRAARPALDALVDVARLALGGAAMAMLWPALRAFLERWLLQPGEGPRVHAVLDDRLAGLAGDAAGGAVTGSEALRLIEEAIASSRVPAGRFGEPAVYVGSVHQAIGLRFRAVRILGLAEGYLPHPPREDPVLPSTLRRSLTRAGAVPVALAASEDRALAALHAVDTVLRDAESRVALSAPRLDLERSQREPSSVLLEAAATLGRPNAGTGERGPDIPDAAALRRDAFRPARRAALAFRTAMPLGEAAWQDGVATGALPIPAQWRGAAVLDVERMRALLDHDGPGPMDGFLGAGTDLAIPGLTAERPLSPSTFGGLLACPHSFLLGTVLGLEEPAGPPPLREIGQPHYGALVHRVAETFLRAHGNGFAARAGTIEAWVARVDEVVESVFGAFVESYPLVGDAVRGRQRERLRDDVRELLRQEWTDTAARRLAGVERRFGPLPIATGAGALFVRGRIDRVDVAGGQTIVRDLKTGRVHLRRGQEAGPSPVIDGQIAIYGLAARQLAGEWGTPPRVGVAYVHINRGVTERAFVDDFEEVLEPAARTWIEVARALLAARSFPRTPSAEDCRYCRFRPVCGDAFHERAARLLATGEDIHRRYLAMRGQAAAGLT